jgi:hypothetical protein
MIKLRRNINGSGVLIVVLSAITFIIYASSTYADQQHFNLIHKKYEKNILEYYEKDNERIDEIYEELEEINRNS